VEFRRIATSIAVALHVTCIACSFLYAGASPKVITAARTDIPPALDGFVTDSQWRLAPPVLDFEQFDPQDGAPPTELTSVRILYDDKAIYVGVICYDADPRRIVHQLTRRDRTTEADRFTVQIDSFNDHQTAFVFSVNVSGVQSDGVLSQDGIVYDLSWDAVWTANTRVYLDGWSAEFAIPYNALRFSSESEGDHEWGINFRRYISRKRETDEWVMIPRSERLLISKWGHVAGIRDIRPPMNLSAIPYVANRSTFQTATPQLPYSSVHSQVAGLDLKYGLTRDFTFDLTVNPDFGQVEVDRAVLNLTVFETLYPEKRPFFVEGAQLFAFGGSAVDNTTLPLFFSRRVGKRPSGSYAPPPGTRFEENPLATTILGAAKITGHTNGGFSLGVMTAATDEEEAVLRDVTGNRSTLRTEPRGLYNVVRMKQEFARNSWIGGIATLASRGGMLPGASGGIDWNVRFDEGAYTLDGYLAGVRSSEEGHDPHGIAGRLLFARIAAEHWRYRVAYDFFSARFNSNDIGYFAQPHDQGGYAAVEYREDFAASPVRRYSITVSPQGRWNWEGVPTDLAIGTRFVGELMNFWGVGLSYLLNVPAYDDEERGILGTYRRPASHSFGIELSSDQRPAVSGSLNMIYDMDAKNKRGLSATLGMTLRPAAWCELNPMVLAGRTRGEEAWVFPTGNIADPSISGSPFSVFGERDVDELDVGMRGTVTFTQTLSLQFYSQLLLARGIYRNYKRLFTSTELLPYDYPSFAGFVNQAFNATTFNANILLRWEFLPGSTLYLVWTQGRFEDSGDYAVSFSRRFTDTFRLPHEDVIVVKLSYWMPF
jgi:hypothetical protein